MLVVFYHAGRLISLPQYVGYIPLGQLFDFGHAGVDFFFVLSGFIIFFVHNGDIGRPARLPRYLWRRATRIYPVFWAICLVSVALDVATHHHLGVPGWLNPQDLLLAPLPGDAPVNMAWTLRNEMLFYLAFASAILNARLGLCVFAAWIATVLLAQTPLALPPVLNVITDTYNFDFIIGATVAHLVLRRTIAAPLAVAITASIAFIVIGLAENAHLIETAHYASRALFGLASGGVVLGIAAAERQGRLSLDTFSPRIGKISYSLYLIHGTVISLAAHVMASLGIIKPLPGVAVMTLVIVIAILCGASLYRIAEAPAAIWQDRAYRRLTGQPARR